jgi:Tfp pilus assembly protein PilF
MKEFESAHTMLESAVGKDHPDVASSFNNMGLVLSQMSGREDDALQMYRDACASFQKSVGSEHPHVGSCLYNSGLMLQTLGRYDEAIQDFTKACDVWEISLGANHPHTGTAQRSIDECKQLLSTQ